MGVPNSYKTVRFIIQMHQLLTRSALYKLIEFAHQPVHQYRSGRLSRCVMFAHCIEQQAVRLRGSPCPERLRRSRLRLWFLNLYSCHTTVTTLSASLHNGCVAHNNYPRLPPCHPPPFEAQGPRHCCSRLPQQLFSGALVILDDCPARSIDCDL